jgi:NAD+-dependent secondary alcohol dehydrogenase Adh1
MKAIRVHGYGQPPQLDAVPADAGLTAYHAVRKAVPALGPGSFAVAVGAGGLGHIGTRTDLEDLVMLTAQGKVVFHSTRYPLEAANDAIDDLRRGRIRGRAILSPG